MVSCYSNILSLSRQLGIIMAYRSLDEVKRAQIIGANKIIRCSICNKVLYLSSDPLGSAYLPVKENIAILTLYRHRCVSLQNEESQVMKRKGNFPPFISLPNNNISLECLAF